MEKNAPQWFFVRPETPADFEQINTVLLSAFKGRTDLVPFVREIRSSANYMPQYSLLAEEQGRIIGHVMLSYITLKDGDTKHAVLSLSPLSVVADKQRMGVGGRLINEVVALADHAGEPLIVLEGSPKYYPRFGFELASSHGITFTLPGWAPPEAAMVKTLSNDDKSIKGHVVYPPAFHVVE